MIAVAFISDRGDQYLPACQQSFAENVGEFDTMTVIDDREHHLGLAGAVRAAWKWALAEGADYLFHVEEDFTFNEPLYVGVLREILEENPNLAQVVLKRNAAPPEMPAGGIIESNPDAYTDRDGWVEHGEIFSLNPCLIPRQVLKLGWPNENEAGFTRACLDRGWRFAFYGQKIDPPRVTHHGVRSAGWRP